MAFSVAPGQAITAATRDEDFAVQRTVLDSSPQDRAWRRLRSPITWFGGKGLLARKIVPLFPPHHCYVEPFCGGASCLFAKSPSPVEVVNDVDGDIVNFFRVLRDPGKFDAF